MRPGMDISLPGGQHLHLVGSIHMGTQDMSPLPSGLIKLLKRADALIVEADISGHESPFAGLESDRPWRNVLTRRSWLSLPVLRMRPAFRSLC